MSISQTMLEFNDIPEPRLVTPEEAREILAEFIARHNLKGLKLDELQLRPDQFEILEEILAHRDQNIGLEFDPGGGKTLVFGTEAVCEFNRPEKYRSLFITDRDRLIKQCAGMFQKFTDFPASSVVCVSGTTSPARRLKLYKTMPRALAVTARALFNDLENGFVWDNIRVVYLDEPQGYIRGKDVGYELVQHLLKLPNVALRVMSGTLVRTPERFAIFRHEVGATKVITVANKFESAEDPLVQLKPEKIADVDERVVEVELDSELKRLVHALRKGAVACTNRIEEMLGEPVLFRVTEDPFMRVPSGPERDEYLARIRAREGQLRSDEIPHLLSLWSQLGKWTNFYHQATSMGRFAFLESYFYQRAKWKIDPSLYLQEVEGSVAVEERCVLKAADRAILGNSDLREVIEEMTMEDPYGAMLRYDTWGEILKDVRKLFQPLERGSGRTVCAERRSKRLKAANAANKGRTAAVMGRLFFHRALSFVAARELSDHPKVPALIDDLDRLKEVVARSKGYIFTWTKRHAEFLAEVLEVRCKRTMGLAPVSVVGGQGAGLKASRKSGLDGFEGSEFNLLVSTAGFAGTGLDVPDASTGFFYTVPDSNPDNVYQPRGRVVGRAKEVAYIRVYVTKGTPEEGRYATALKKHGARRRATRSRAKVLIPKYAVRKH